MLLTPALHKQARFANPLCLTCVDCILSNILLSHFSHPDPESVDHAEWHSHLSGKQWLLSKWSEVGVCVNLIVKIGTDRKCSWMWHLHKLPLAQTASISPQRSALLYANQPYLSVLFAFKLQTCLLMLYWNYFGAPVLCLQLLRTIGVFVDSRLWCSIPPWQQD